MGDVKRRYHAPRRDAQAAATRRRILDAAQRRLTSVGWTGATMTAIASDAGVAVQTVYAVFGSKGAILAALLDDLEAAALAAGDGDPGEAAPDPVGQLRRVVAFNRRLFELGGELIDVAQGSRAVDPDLAANVAEGHRRRRDAQRPVVEAWARRGALRDGLGGREALLILWTMTSPDVHRLVTADGGMGGDAYEAWLARMLARELFGRPDGRDRAAEPSPGA
jgi:TetR/AcrR family transcriptional regulator, regulator of autoinduction and epiphytic fitness